MKSASPAVPPSGRTNLLDALKRAAKDGKKANPASKPLSWYQDQIAVAFGYGNWSTLHKHLMGMSNAHFDKLKAKMLAHPQVGPFLQSIPKVFDKDAAYEEMRAWVKARFTPLIDFAYYDSESPNGFAWPDVDLREELQDHFGGTYPDSLIEEVADDLEQHGPWGEEMDPEDADQGEV